MWQSDPFKAKWSILAKSYSLIRDSQGKDKTPLDQFLAITGPLIGIIMPGHYLQAMGWEIATNDTGHTVMHRIDRILDERLFLTNLSVNDLIRHCANQGFFVAELAEVVASDNEAVMTMASSIQCSNNLQTSLPNEVQVNHAGFANDVEAGGLREEAELTSKHDSITLPTSNDNSAYNAMEAHGGIANPGRANTFSNASIVAKGNGAITISAPSYATGIMFQNATPGHEKLTAEALPTTIEAEPEMQRPEMISDNLNPASGLSAASFELTSQYPFNAEFDPNSPAFVFDPFLGNQFDVFEMSDLSWAELVDFEDCA